MAARVQGNAIVNVNTQNPLTQEKKHIEVYESHAYCIARLPVGFSSLASSEYCKHEIFAHGQKPVYGTQFHPEKSASDGLALLSSFVDLEHEGFYLHKQNT